MRAVRASWFGEGTTPVAVGDLGDLAAGPVAAVRGRVEPHDPGLRPDLAARFKVDEVPTLVLVQDKRVSERLDGRVSSPRIERMLEEHLEPVPA